MALLVGQEAEGTGATAAPATGKAQAFKFTAAATGKVTALHMKFNESGSGSEAKIALMADGGGKPAEGVLAEGTLSSVVLGERETTSLSAEPEVKAGTVYWLAIMPLGGTCKFKQGSTAGRCKSGTTRSKLSEEKSADWEAEETKGPVAIWATGTEGGGKTTYEAAVSLRAGAATGVQAKNVASGSISLRVGSAVKTQATNIAAAAVSLRAGSSVKAQANMVALATMDHPTPRVTPFVTGVSVGIAIEAGARMQVSAQRVVQSAVSLRAGARTSTVARLIAQTSVSFRAGARIATSAQLVAAISVQLRTGAILVVTTEGAQFVETWTAAGSSTLIPTAAGDTPVTYSTAGDEVAIQTYAGDG